MFLPQQTKIAVDQAKDAAKQANIKARALPAVSNRMVRAVTTKAKIYVYLAEIEAKYGL